MRASSLGRTFLWPIVLSTLASGASSAQLAFPTPEDAANALIAAVEAGDEPLLLSIAGGEMAPLWQTDDPVRNTIEREFFLHAARTRGVRTEPGPAEKRMLYVNGIAEPFPAPLVKSDCGWRFDGAAGAVELTERRIRRNETAVIELCRRFLEAEFAYSDGRYGGTAGFAQRINSTHGSHDGLFWPGGEDEESPLGPMFAAAAFTERRLGMELRPLFGYYFRILSPRISAASNAGPAPRVNGPAHEGFTLVAWPAEYGALGIRTFLITESGEIYQRDLGVHGGRFVEAVAVLHPDHRWSRGDATPSTRRAREISR